MATYKQRDKEAGKIRKAHNKTFTYFTFFDQSAVLSLKNKNILFPILRFMLIFKLLEESLSILL
jgi:hypothetical protein